ncbi:hypothetical protein ABPG73_003989 [Tetrahymena malaccensis]
MQDQSITKQVKKYKLVFIGDQSVGKTSIINRFINDSFQGTQQPTVGIDFVAKTLHLDNKTIRLQLWDTAGQERFRSLIPSYIRDSDAAIIVYDITNQASFASVNKWLDYVREERGDGVLIVLLANKLDISDQRAVQTADGQQYAKQQNLIFSEVSAKEGNNINDVFKNLAQLLQGSEKSDQTDMDFGIKGATSNPSKCTTAGGTIQLSNNQEAPVKQTQDKQCQC